MRIVLWILEKVFWFVKVVKIRALEKGLYFRDREFKAVLGVGTHWIFDPLVNVRVDVVSQRNVWLLHDALDVIVKSGALGDDALVLDLKDHERALVRIDGRIDSIVGPGRFALWTRFYDVAAEIIDARTVRVDRPDLNVILNAPRAASALAVFSVEPGFAGVFFKDGAYAETLAAGRYAFWKDVARIQIVPIDLRESVLDVAGQEIMTADKVTLRLNAVAVYRVVDAKKAVTVSGDAKQALYREAQLALRAVIGTRELDALLAEKDTTAETLAAIVRNRAAAFGLQVESIGIRDIILPGEMKDLLNKVTEAKKAAEASLITRREETAAMRNQANTAKLLENNATLMRLKELEVLSKVAEHAKLSVVLGDKGLRDRVVNLL